MAQASTRTAGAVVAATGVALGLAHLTHATRYPIPEPRFLFDVLLPVALAGVVVGVGYLLAAGRLVRSDGGTRAVGWMVVGIAVLEAVTAWMLASILAGGGAVPDPGEALLNAATVGGLVGLLVGAYDARVREHQRYVDQSNRINNTLRIATQELVHADSRDEIERAVCARLTESAPYDSAWVGRYDREAAEVVPSTWAGIDDEYVESIVITVDDSPLGRGPGGEAIKTGELQAVQNVLNDPSAEPWRDLFESRGVESLAVVPFVRRDEVFGFVSVYANRPNVFDERERQVLAELGETVGHAIHSIRTRDRLAAREAELERQNERLEEFASVVSHDLRNPLNTAEGYLDLARGECDSDHLSRVQTALERMDELIEDVLTLARQGQTVSTRETVPLRAVAEAAWETAGAPAATLRIAGDLGELACDASRLQQLLENLFRNAVEHSSTSSRTESDNAVEHGSTGNQTKSDDVVEHGSTSRQPQADDAVEQGGTDVTVTVGRLPTGFYVADDGPGIPPDEREAVFEAGYSTSREGTGFGLNIVRSLAQAHGWSVTLAESEDGGARFEFTGVDGERAAWTPADEGPATGREAEE